MSENSRMKKLPIAVLAAPALAFGSLTLTAVPALAVPEDDVRQILNEVDTIVVVADQETNVYRDGEVDGVINVGAVISAIGYEDGQLVAYDGARYDADDFSHASETQYEDLSVDFPSLLQEDDSPEPGDAEDEVVDDNEGNEDEVIDEEDQSVDPTIRLETDEIFAGDVVDLLVSGFTANSTVELRLNSELLETTETDETGAFNTLVFFPEVGTHELIATGAEGEEATLIATVEEPTALPSPEPFSPLSPELSTNVTEARVGNTIRFTIDNVDELLKEQEFESELYVEGFVADAEGTVGSFGREGITAVEGTRNTFEFKVPSTIETDEGNLNIGAGSQFMFGATVLVALDEENEMEYSSNFVAVDIIGDEVVISPHLTVSTPEIVLEDFIGDPLEGAGVLHELTGFEPGTEIEYSVATPEGIEPFSESGFIGEDGEAAFRIYGEDFGDTSVYLGDYTTTVSFVDDNGETQELIARFSVVTGGTGAAPVVDTEATGDAPAVGASADNLAKTGASGTQLALLAGGLLVLGGAALAFANRRLRSRKN